MTDALEQAKRWFVRMCNAAPDDPDRSRFETWLTAHPSHAAAYAACADLWSQLESNAQCHAIADALQTRRQRQWRATRRVVARGGGLGLLLLGAGGLAWHHWRGEAVFELARSTGTGAVRREGLPDGSTLVLDAATEVAVRYTRAERWVGLAAGKAIFDVARDPEHPFVVESGGLRVTVLGTRFAVTRLTDRIKVSVDHGRVQLETGPFWRRQRLLLTDGQVAQLDLVPSQDGILRLSAQQAAADFSFELGTLMFDRADLVEVAQTLSRYRAAPVRVAGLTQAAGGGPRITAGIAATRVEGFIDLLPDIALVTAARRANGEVELRPR